MSREPYATGPNGEKYYSRKEFEKARIRHSNNAQHRRRRILG
ncbi:hypothetical protein [Bacteroides pyogenes]